MAPRVSVIIPARNEAEHIEACLRSVLAQETDGEIEIIVADGQSSDETAAVARASGARVVDNPERITPTALNHGLQAARADVVLRFDAHSQMSPGYIAACLEALAEEPEAVNVGGWCRVEGAGPWARAIGAALGSPLGVGNPRLWRPPRNGDRRREVETVPFGCFPAAALRRVGGWRGDLVRNQDFELNYRLRAAGGRIIFDPAISFVYRPRESLEALWRQYWTFGRWKATVLLMSPRSLRPRQLAPLLLLGALGAALVPGRQALPARAVVFAYAAMIAGATARLGAGWRAGPVFATMHVAWGGGVLAELGSRLVRKVRRAAASGP
jgi:succinoglycan biosynthesis protein ExoA